MGSGFGFSIDTDAHLRKDAFLFGEAQSRVIVTVDPNLKALFEAELGDTAHSYLGRVNANHEICVDQAEWGYLSDWEEAYDNALGKLLNA